MSGMTKIISFLSTSKINFEGSTKPNQLGHIGYCEKGDQLTRRGCHSYTKREFGPSHQFKGLSAQSEEEKLMQSS